MSDKHTEWWKYVELIMRLEDLTPGALAKRLGIAGTTPSQWRDEGRLPRPEVARKFAQTFGRPVPEAFFKANIMEPADLDYVAAPLPSAAHLSNEVLMAEVHSRLIPDRTDEAEDELHDTDDKFDGRSVAVKRTARKATAKEPKTTPTQRRAPR